MQEQPISTSEKKNGFSSLMTPPLWWVIPLYFAQGLPYGVVQLMAPIYFTDMGISLGAIGLMSLLGLPWNLKFFWSPLVDLIGSRKKWVATTLTLLVPAIALVALTSEQNFGQAVMPLLGQAPLSVWITALILLAVAFLSSTADISQDAFYMDALDSKQQALFVGVRVTAYRIAMLFCSGLLVFLAGKFGWTMGYGLAAAAMLIAVLWNLIALPTPESARNVDGKNFFKEFGRAFISYVNRPRAVALLAFILTYKLGEQMIGRMATPFFMRQLSITTEQMGILSGVLGVGASILGAIAGSVWIVRRGMWFALISITLAMNGTDILYILLSIADNPSWAAICVVHSVENFSGGLGSAAFAYFLIRTCSKEFRAAHYAIATGLMSVGGVIAASIGGFITESVGYAWYFTLCTALSVPGIFLLFVLPKDLTERQ